MADNVAITPGAGATVRADETSAGIFAQVMRLDVGAEGQAERLGLAQSKLIPVTIASLTTATTLYTAGDVLGGELTFASSARASGLGCQIVSALLLCNTPTAIPGAVDLFIFDRASTPAANNAANSWADADIANLLTVINFPGVTQSALNAWSFAVGGLPVVAVPNATSLFGVLVTRTTHTVHFGSTTDITVKLGVIPD